MKMYYTDRSIRTAIVNRKYSCTKLCNYTGISLDDMIKFVNGEDCLSFEELLSLEGRLVQADRGELDFRDIRCYD